MRRLARASTYALLLALGVGCIFEPGSLEDLACDEAGACEPGFACVAGRCVAEGSDAGLSAVDAFAPDGAGGDIATTDSAHIDAAADDISTVVDAASPDTVGADGAQLDAAHHDAALADGAAADAGNDAASLEAGAIDSAAVDVSAVDSAAPDSWTADSAASDVSMLDTAASDTSAPDTSSLDTSLLDTSVPDTWRQDTLLPDTSLPDTSLPDTLLPDVTTDAFSVLCDGLGPDEDGDLLPDHCDNCPTVPNVDQLNIKEINATNLPDSVGDACDPRPTLSGDSILFFDGFSEDLAPEWHAVEQGWSTSAGKLFEAGARDISLIERADVPLEDFLLHTRGRFEVVQVGKDHEISVMFKTPAPINWGCTLSDGVNSDTFELESYDDQGDFLAQYEEVSIEDLSAGPHDLKLTLVGGQMVCEYPDEPAAVTRIFPSEPIPMGIGLRTDGGSYSFDWVIIYGLGGPLP